MRSEERGARGEGRGAREDEKEAKGGTLHQSNTLLIILQASDGAGAQYFLPIMFYLFVCEFGSTSNFHALDECSSQHSGMHHTFTLVPLPT